MDFKVAYVVMLHNSDREVYRSYHRWEAVRWITDKFDGFAPNSGLAEFYIREVWTNIAEGYIG